MTIALALSAQARRTTDQPITHYMQLALGNPELISLAAGLVDQESLPVAEVSTVLAELFAAPDAARAALQYGTTQGLPELREQICRLVARLDGVTPAALGITAEETIITTGSRSLPSVGTEVAAVSPRRASGSRRIAAIVACMSPRLPEP